MPFPPGWPPRAASGRRSIRFFAEGTATANFSDNGLLFADGAGANTFIPLPVVKPGSSEPVHIGSNPQGGGTNIPTDVAPDTHKGVTGLQQAVPPTMIWAQMIAIANTGVGTLEFSFDGTNVHGRVEAGERRIFRMRYEAGIALKGNGADVPTFEIEAW